MFAKVNRVVVVTNIFGVRLDDAATRVGALNLLGLVVKTSP